MAGSVASLEYRDRPHTSTIAETHQYLDTVDELLPKCTTALDFFNAMLERYPNRLNPGALWSGATALYA